MAIQLGDYAFDAVRTAVSEKYEEAGGRDARVIQLQGLIEGKGDHAAVELELDRILAAASGTAADTALSLRPGRRLWVRRTGFKREIMRDTPAASFVLRLEAPDPFEESESRFESEWNIATSGAVLPLMNAGNAATPLLITLAALNELVHPAFRNGDRGMVYQGVLSAGDDLIFDGEAKAVWLNGEDVTPYTTGRFPWAAPGASSLIYEDAEESSHQAQAVVSFRGRWW